MWTLTNIPLRLEIAGIMKIRILVMLSLGLAHFQKTNQSHSLSNAVLNPIIRIA
jgi:hypothetical protein